MHLLLLKENKIKGKLCILTDQKKRIQQHMPVKVKSVGLISLKILDSQTKG